MKLILHNLKVAVRNLMKYKIQTSISVLSIAIGIVTLALSHSVLNNFRLPTLWSEDYYDRTYRVRFISEEGENVGISPEMIRAIKGNDGLKNAERIAVPSGLRLNLIGAEFLLPDSSIRKGSIDASIIDPEYANYAGFRSAVTGIKIRVLKSGEAIISESMAKRLFKDKNPIGAIQTVTADCQPIPVTIVDVYQNLSNYESPFYNDIFYFTSSDKIEDVDPDFLYAVWINVVLKEGGSLQKLEEEITQRIKPFGLNVKISEALEGTDFIIGLRLFAYFISALILIAAIIGYLRIQIQLFWIRRRELSLRIVNGASRIRLFSMLIFEAAITICLSIITAIILSLLLENFLNSELSILIDDNQFNFSKLWFYSIVIGGGLFAIGCLTIWLTVKRIAKSGERLAANMRRSRNHLFRNAMLGLQIAICSLFVCATIILTRGGNEILKAYHIPENDNFYRDCIFLMSERAEHPEQLIEEIKRLPDLSDIIMYSVGYTSVSDVSDNPEAKEKLDGQTYFPFTFMNDTSSIGFSGMKVEWLQRSIDRNRCLLISEKLYSQFSELGLLDDNSLTFKKYVGNGFDSFTLPVAGIIKYLTYETNDMMIAAINSEWNDAKDEYVLIPKPGKGKALAREVNEVIVRLEPKIMNDMTINFRQRMSPESLLVSTVRNGGRILGIISLIICAMSIFSSITLDTRSKKKEVAVRKVNGAKSKDIYRMFGKVYIILLLIASVIVIPASVLFNRMIMEIVNEVAPNVTLSPVGPIALGLTIMILLISIIVGCQIRKTMKENPAKIIAKE